MIHPRSNPPSRPLLQKFLEGALPGRSSSIQRTREQILEFAGSLTARSVLLRGPVGAGKSTVARMVALLKRASPLEVTEAERVVGDARFDGHNRIDLRYMPWYVELALTGLVESLAETQLFGSVEGAYTGATDKSGLFEQAITGRSAKGKEPTATSLTGGIVFLDEIGDMAPALQAKLLPVLTGAPFYRVGGEGNERYELQFRGITIVASWRELDARTLRPDLLSRVAAYTIDVPGIAERPEDFDALVDEVQKNVLDSLASAVENASRVEPALDRNYWRKWQGELRPVSRKERTQLRRVDWGSHGNIRGLTSAIEQVIGAGRDIEQVLEELPVIAHGTETTARNHGGLLHQLIKEATADEGLSGNVKRLEVLERAALRERLLVDGFTRRKLAERLHVDDQQLLSQVYQLDRRRRKAAGGEG